MGSKNNKNNILPTTHRKNAKTYSDKKGRGTGGGGMGYKNQAGRISEKGKANRGGSR
jgi:hypothetical protein